MAFELYGWILRQDIQVHQWIIASVTVASVFATLVIACIYWTQLGQMTIATGAAKKAADTAHDALLLDHCAWIGITFPPLDVDKEIDGKLFMVPITIENTGNAPAKKVTIKASTVTA